MILDKYDLLEDDDYKEYGYDPPPAGCFYPISDDWPSDEEWKDFYENDVNYE